MHFPVHFNASSFPSLELLSLDDSRSVPFPTGENTSSNLDHVPGCHGALLSSPSARAEALSFV